MRVVVVTSSYNYIADGVALTLNRWVAYLESRGAEVLVVAPVARVAAFPHSGTLIPAPSIPIPLRPEYRLALGLTAQLRRQIAEFQPDIMHLATPDVLGHQTLEFAIRSGIPVVASFHTRYETYLSHYGLGLLQGPVSRLIARFYQRCREVYVPSASMAQVLIEEGALNTQIWARGVDTHRFDPARRNLEWRRSMGFADEDMVVSFVSRLVREKRLSSVISTIQLLRAQGMPHRMMFVGEGPERDALTRALPGAVFTGRLDGEALATAYASSDLFFFPSDTETFGSVTLEAMASGLPTLCADATGSRSLVEDGFTGFLAQAEDAQSFASHITTLQLRPTLRHALGTAARARSLSFSWDAVMGGLMQRFGAIVGDQ